MNRIEAVIGGMKMARELTQAESADRIADLERAAETTARVRSMREAAAKAMTCSQCGKRPATCVGAYEDATVDSPACDECCAHGNEDGRCEPIDGPARIRALPLDTGTATDTGGEATQADAGAASVQLRTELTQATGRALRAEDQLAENNRVMMAWAENDTTLAAERAKWEAAQADAIKAAVVAANNRAADAFHEWWNALEGTPLRNMDGDQFEAWLRSGAVAPGAVTTAKGGE